MTVTAVPALVEPEPTEEELVEQAKTAEIEAEATEAEAGSPHRWKMADSYAALKEHGWTQQRIAGECEVDQSTVSRYIKCVELYALVHNRPLFTQALREAMGRPSAGSPSKKEPDQTVYGQLEEHLTAIKKLSNRWHEDLIAPHSPRKCRRNVRIASEITAWLSEEFIPAHDEKVTPVPVAPANTGGV